MYHLIGRYYIDYISCFLRYPKATYLTQEIMPHPISKLIDKNVGETTTLKAFICDNHQGSETKFWLDAKEGERIVFCCDNKTLSKLLFQFWKSIFKSHDTAFFLTLYKLMQKWWEIKIQIEYLDKMGQLEKFEQPFPNLDEKQVKALIEEVNIIDLTPLDYEELNIEYLYGAWLVNNSFQYKLELQNQIKKRQEEVWFRKLQELRETLLQNYYQLSREEQNQVSWIFDNKIKYGNASYVKKFFLNYNFNLSEKIISNKTTHMRDHAEIEKYADVISKTSLSDELEKNFHISLAKKILSLGGSYFAIDYLKKNNHQLKEHYILR